ncbi:MAG: ABC transporter permease subunit [Chloroflexi bacterium]|nr:ABC transporter permease subunit [Chloroflexota bacterium]
MVNVIRAEWLKMVGNRWTTGFLIWIFPVGALGLVGGMSLMALLSPNVRDNITPLLWTNNFMVPWNFANNLFGRTFLLGFTAVTFAGEYQWGTWKNIVPRQQRSRLIVAKFINLVVLILIAFGLMSLIFGFGYGILSRIADVSYGPEVTSKVVREFLSNYALQATLTFISVIIASIYAALSALLMQSILGGVMVGIGVSVAEPLIIPGGMALARMFDRALFLHLGRFSPYYNIANVNSWVHNDQALNWLETSFQQFNQAAPVDSVSFSVLVLATWLLVGIGLVLILFQRQDITT